MTHINDHQKPFKDKFNIISGDFRLWASGFWEKLPFFGEQLGSNRIILSSISSDRAVPDTGTIEGNLMLHYCFGPVLRERYKPI